MKKLSLTFGLVCLLFSVSAEPSMAESGYKTLVAGMNIPRMVNGAWVMPRREAGGGRRTAVEDYSSQIAEACAYYGCNPGYLETVMECESHGDPLAVAYNPVSGNYTYGIFQIDAMWGGASMSSTEQIWFAAEHLTAGDIWWACQ